MITLIYLISSHTKKTEITVRPIAAVWGNVLVSLIMVAILGASGYGLYRSYSSEHIFYSSLQKAKENNGTQTYNMQIKAIQANQYISRFHLIYSQTNLALAISLTNAINQSGDKETPEQKTKDQQLVAQLIQQSIREAKLATTLNSQSVLAWENLARIYNQLIDTAQGADTWTIASYNKAIELDPYNPILRLELGSVAMKKKQYTDAITLFQKSASLKQNYANAYYNLAYAYKENGDMSNAINALKMTQSLLDTTSSDYAKVSKDIESLSEAK
jgi:tetratricopeptide (TPR) repeat protein